MPKKESAKQNQPKEKEEEEKSSEIEGPKKEESKEEIKEEPEKIFLSWTAPEYVHYEKSQLWFLGAGVIMGLLVVYAIIVKQWLMAAAFVAAAIALFRFTQIRPELREHSISNKGVKIGKNFFPYSKIKSFWIIDTTDVKTLNLESLRKLLPILKIQLQDIDSQKLREILKKYLPEQEGREDDLIDKFSRWIKF